MHFPARFAILLSLLSAGCSDGDTVETNIDARAQQLCFEQFSTPSEWEFSGEYWLKTLPAHRDGCFLAQATLQVGLASAVSGYVCNVCDEPQVMNLVGLISIPLGIRYKPPGQETQQLTCLDSPMPTEDQAVSFVKKLPPGDFIVAYSFLFETTGIRDADQLEVLWPDFTARPPTYEGAVNGHSCLKRGRLASINPSDFSIQVITQELE